MHLTALSFVILPLCLIWIGSPARLLKLMLTVSIFEAAAVLVVGALGVQPGLAPALIFMGFVSLQVLLGARYPGTREVLNAVWPFILVVAWAVVSSYVMPRLFAGKAMIWPQKQLPPFTLVPLEPTGNMNQDIYLVLNCLLCVLGALFLTKSGLRLGSFLNFYFYSGFLVAAVSVWQFASKVAGIPYPEDVFYSNPGWAILTGQSIGRVPRINGPFTEPAALATYMSSIVCATGWIILQGNANLLTRVLLIVGLLTMMLSTSTTGFGVLAIVAAGLFVLALFSGSFKMLLQALKLVLPLVLVFGITAGVASVAVTGFSKNVSEVVNATASKQGSSSYNDRTSEDLDSLQAAIDTDGLGVGWGTNRSSSLIPGLFSGMGVPGVTGLVVFAVSLGRRVRRARRLQPSTEHKMIIDGCCGGLIGYILASCLSGPSITSVTFYFLLAMLIACLARVGIDRQDEELSVEQEYDAVA